jgi:hypothetical protein
MSSELAKQKIVAFLHDPKGNACDYGFYHHEQVRQCLATIVGKDLAPLEVSTLKLPAKNVPIVRLGFVQGYESYVMVPPGFVDRPSHFGTERKGVCGTKTVFFPASRRSCGTGKS